MLEQADFLMAFLTKKEEEEEEDDGDGKLLKLHWSISVGPKLFVKGLLAGHPVYLSWKCWMLQNKEVDSCSLSLWPICFSTLFLSPHIEHSSLGIYSDWLNIPTDDKKLNESMKEPRKYVSKLCYILARPLFIILNNYICYTFSISSLWFLLSDSSYFYWEDALLPDTIMCGGS